MKRLHLIYVHENDGKSNKNKKLFHRLGNHQENRVFFVVVGKIVDE